MQNNMEELIPINVVIADRSYRLKVEPKDEEMVRKTVKLINEKVLEFKNKFAGKDTQGRFCGGYQFFWQKPTF